MEYLEWAIPEKIQTGGVEDILFEKKKKKKTAEFLVKKIITINKSTHLKLPFEITGFHGDA